MPSQPGKYNLALRNDKVKQYNRFAIFIILLNLLVLLAVSYFSAESRIRVYAFFGSLTIAVTLIVMFFLVRRKQHTESIYLLAGLFFSFLTWMQVGNVWASIIIVLLMLLYIIAKKPVIIHFENDQIVYSTIPKKSVSWDQLSNVMLKDGLLTIDYRSNKIMQAEIVDLAGMINEKDFNEFCSQRLRDVVVPA